MINDSAIFVTTINVKTHFKRSSKHDRRQDPGSSRLIMPNDTVRVTITFIIH
jgi:hypothetical protein